jgi:hypothetical protein
VAAFGIQALPWRQGDHTSAAGQGPLSQAGFYGSSQIANGLGDIAAPNGSLRAVINQGMLAGSPYLFPDCLSWEEIVVRRFGVLLPRGCGAA